MGEVRTRRGYKSSVIFQKRQKGVRGGTGVHFSWVKYGPGGGTNPLLFSKVTKRGQRRDWSPFFLGEFMPGVGGGVVVVGSHFFPEKFDRFDNFGSRYINDEI